MKFKMRIIGTMLLAFLLICSQFTVLAAAADSVNSAKAAEIGNNMLKTSVINQKDVQEKEDINSIHIKEETELKTDHSKPIIDISSKIQSKGAVKNSSEAVTAETTTPASIVLAANPRTVVNGALTSKSDASFVFFSVTKNSFMVTSLASANPDYYINLYIVDYTAGIAVPTEVVGLANEVIGLNGLPQGDYALAVASVGSLGDSYSLKINATNPSGNYKSYYLTPSLQQFVITYSSNDVYANGTYVYNTSPTASTSHLDWNRNFLFSWDGNYIKRNHSIFSVKIKRVLGPVSYTSQYASSDNAMLILLDKNTGFTYFESQFQSFPHYYYNSFNDVLGKRTPRSLDDEDFEVLGEHMLVYDLNTGKPIDLYSNLNFFYASGAESQPVITFLDD